MMRRCSGALAMACMLLFPLEATAANAAQQTTATQSDLKSSVKAKPPTHKRHQIIRSEQGGTTNGAAPRSR